MMIDFIHTILNSGEVLTNAYFFFFLIPLIDEEVVNKEVEKEMEKYPDIKNPIQAKQIITAILFDDFGPKSHIHGRYSVQFNMLEILKKKVFKFYFQHLSKIDTTMEYRYVADLYTTMGNYILQMARLRMVINPDINLTINIHHKSKISYLIAKAYWFDDNGKKVRIFSKSLGRLDAFKDGIKDKEAENEAKEILLKLMYKKYEETYP